ncbi:unnamed protein product [Orchesella dallaii]|uniref:DUF4806 domain-containing protein n=1 Tax=Orchesella dallaii TaxID=48710 RepID=A0ABP1RV36_9HEXA
MGDSDNYKFSVVHFKSDNAVEIVPINWLFQENGSTYCHFPQNNSNIRKLISKPDAQPGRDWNVFEIEKVVKSYNTFKRAEKRAKKYIENSDDDSTEAESIGRRKRRKIADSPPDVSCPQVGFENFIPAAPNDHYSGTIILPALPSRPIDDQDLTRVQIEIDSGPTVDPIPSDAQRLAYDDAILNYSGSLSTTEFQEEALLKLVTLESSVNEVKILLLKLLANQGSNTTATTDSASTFPLLPLTSAEDLEAIEQWLNDTENKKRLVLALSKIGGQKISSNVYNVLSQVIGTSFAKEIRFTGASGKLPFGTLKLADVVRDSVRVYAAEPVTDSIIDQFIGRWFRNSNDRKGGRKLKTSKKNLGNNDNGNSSNHEEETGTPKLSLVPS